MRIAIKTVDGSRVPYYINKVDKKQFFADVISAEGEWLPIDNILFNMSNVIYIEIENEADTEVSDAKSDTVGC